MNAEEYLNEMKTIQKNLLDYIYNEANVEENYQNLIQIFDDIKIYDNQHKVKSLLYLTFKISNNHYRGTDFFNKIEKILLHFKDNMKKYFSNSELFHIFRGNKRLLLFLFEENIMAMDEFIVKSIIYNGKYLEYKYPLFFQPEIQPYVNEEWFPKNKAKETGEEEGNEWIEEIKKELPKNFHEKRRIGENDDDICSLIRKDSIEDFITSINKNLFSVNSTINSSIYETNNFLLKKGNITLIEYAVFFGSAQIFTYLRKNGAEIKPTLWVYAVHGQSEEIIHFLEDNKILPNKNEKEQKEEEGDEYDDDKISFREIFNESIKCHHIDVAIYIESNYLRNNIDQSNNRLTNSLKYYNFLFIGNRTNYKTFFYYFCKYDYYLLVVILSKNTDIDINREYILIHFF